MMVRTGHGREDWTDLGEGRARGARSGIHGSIVTPIPPVVSRKLAILKPCTVCGTDAQYRASANGYRHLRKPWPRHQAVVA